MKFYALLSLLCILQGCMTYHLEDIATEMIEFLIEGELRSDEVEQLAGDLGLQVDMEDIEATVLKYTEDQEQPFRYAATDNRRKKRSISAPLHYVDLGLASVTEQGSTAISTDGKTFSHSFNLRTSEDANDETFIIIDNKIYSVSTNQLVEKNTLPYDGFADMKVTRIEVVGGHDPSLAYAVLVTLQGKSGDLYNKAVFTAWKIKLESADSLTISKIDDFQVVSRTDLTAENSMSRVSILPWTSDGVLIATFHRLTSETVADGLHLVFLNEDLGLTFPVVDEEGYTEQEEIIDDLRDIELIQHFGADTAMMVVSNHEHNYIFNIQLNSDGETEMTLMQKYEGIDPSDIVFSSDMIGSFLTIVSKTGTTETLLFDENSFVKIGTFEFSLIPSSWRSVETNVSEDLSKQDLVLAQSNDGDLVFLHHSMPGVYTELTFPSSLDDYIALNQGLTVIDLAKRKTDVDTYEYFALFQHDDSIDLVTLALSRRPETINFLNDVIICYVNHDTNLNNDDTWNTAINSIETGLIPLNSVQDDIIISTKKFNGVDADFNIDKAFITLESDNSIDYTSIDYTNDASIIKTDHQLVNLPDDNPGHLFASSLFVDGPFQNANSDPYSITAPDITIDGSTIVNLQTTDLGPQGATAKVDDLVKNVLMTVDDQDINIKMEFKEPLTVTDSFEIGDGATSKIDPFTIDATSFIDLTKSNTISPSLTVKKIIMNADQTVQKVNDIRMSEVISKTEMTSSNSENPIVITDDKIITTSVAAHTMNINLVNGEDLTKWYTEKVIFKDEETQTFNIKKLDFDTFNVAGNLNINQFDGKDITEQVLNDIVRVDTHAVVTEQVTFQKNLVIDSLQTSSLNSVNPDDYLKNNVDQVITADITATNLIADNVKDSLINTRDLSNSAQINQQNIIQTPLEFTKDVTVKGDITFAENIGFNGIDFSSLQPFTQVYEGTVTVVTSMELDDIDVQVDRLELEETHEDPFTKANIEQKFLLKDIPQTMPDLASITQDISVDNFEVGQTLDGLDLTNVLMVEGNQDVSTSIELLATSTFYGDITIQENNSPTAAIGNVLIKDLVENIYCPHTEIGAGSIEITNPDAIIKSYFDVKVSNSFKVTNAGVDEKNYETFTDDTIIKLATPQHFTKKVTMNNAKFTNGLNSQVNIGGPTNSQVNNKNLQSFTDSIVYKTGEFTGDKTIATDVTINNIVGNGELLSSSTFDGKSLFNDYDNYIILDKKSGQDIKSTFKLNNAQFTNLTIKDVNINEQNLQTYRNSLYDDSKSMEGSKTLEGTVSVGGNVITAHGFLGVDVKNLKSKALSKTLDQSIHASLTMKDVNAKTIFTTEVNDVALADVCFIDEYCSLKTGSTLKFQNTEAIFQGGVGVKTHINEKPANEWISRFTSREIGEIQTLIPTQLPVFTQKSTDTYSFSNLIDNSVKRTSAVDQAINEAVTFTQLLTVKDLDVTSGIINEGLDGELDVRALYLDAANKSEANTFTSAKTVSNINVNAGSLSVKKLSDTNVLNGVNIQDLWTNMLKKTGGDSGQTVTHTHVFTKGLQVTNNADFKELDGIKDTEFVLKSVAETIKSLPGIILDSQSTVDGNLVTENTDNVLAKDLQTMLDKSIRTCRTDDQQVVNVKLKLNNDVTATNAKIDKLNGMDTSNFVLKDSSSEQVITQPLTFQQNQLNIDGDLTGKINDIGLDEVLPNILMMNQAANIENAGTKVVFNEDVTSSEMTIDDLTVGVSDGIIDIFYDFTQALLTFYKDKITSPMDSLLEEIYVSNRVALGTVKYLDKINYDSTTMLNDVGDDDDIISLNTEDFGQGKFMTRLQRSVNGSDTCPMTEGCSCKTTRIATKSDLAFEVSDFHDTVFQFCLKSFLVTVTSSYDGDGTSNDCNQQAGSGDLLINVIATAGEALHNDVGGVTAITLGTIYTPSKIENIYEVLGVKMWEVGDVPFLAITAGYSPTTDTNPTGSPRLLVYKLVGGTWTEELNLEGTFTHLNTISLSVKNENDEILDVVHLITAKKFDDGTSQVLIYAWSYNPTLASFVQDKELIQTIYEPVVSAMETFSCKIKNAEVMSMLILAGRLHNNFIDSSAIFMLSYSAKLKQYVFADVKEKYRLMGRKLITKISSKKLTDYDTLAVSTKNKIQLLNYIPNYGLKFISEYKVDGKLVDWTWFQDVLPRPENFTPILLLIVEKNDVRSIKALRIGVEGIPNIPPLYFKPDNLGF